MYYNNVFWKLAHATAFKELKYKNIKTEMPMWLEVVHNTNISNSEFDIEVATVPENIIKEKFYI